MQKFRTTLPVNEGVSVKNETNYPIRYSPDMDRIRSVRKRSYSVPNEVSELLGKNLAKYTEKYKQKQTGGGEHVSTFTHEYRKAAGKAETGFLRIRRRQESDAKAFKKELKTRQTKFNFSKKNIDDMKVDHKFEKNMFVREISEKTSNFEDTVEERFGADLAEIYKVKLGDRFNRGEFDNSNSIRDISSIEEFEKYLSDSTSSSGDEESNDTSTNKYASPFQRKPGSSQPTLPRVREDSELPFSPLTKKKYYFPKIKKRVRKRSNIKYKDFDVNSYLRNTIFSKRKFKRKNYSGNSSDEEDSKLSNNDNSSSCTNKKSKNKLSMKKIDCHESKMSEYTAQIYSLVNSPRGTVNKEIEKIKKQREDEKLQNEKNKKNKQLKDEKMKFEDHLDQIIKKCKGCLKAYLFMNHLYETFLINKREERKMEELSRDTKSLKFQKMFSAKFLEDGESKKGDLYESIISRNRRIKQKKKLGNKKKKLGFKEKYKMLLRQQKKNESRY